MIESIFVAMTGMQGHQRGLGVISGNVANLNTVGFRGSTVDFADVFFGAAAKGAQGGQSRFGSGLDASRTLLNLQTAQPQQTGRELDLALFGEGFFLLHDETGLARYSRDGQFEFNRSDELVTRGQQLKVMSRDAAGALVPLSLAGLRVSPSRVTTEVVFDRILSTGDDEHTIDPLVIFDQAGGRHALKVVFEKDTAPPPPGVSVNWKVTVFENEQEVGRGDLAFNGAQVAPGSSPMNLSLALPGVGPTTVAFNFDAVTGVDIGTGSELRVLRQDGLAAGTISSTSFDDDGVLRITYSNGQKAEGGRLALAQIRDAEGLVSLGDALFAYEGSEPVVIRQAGDDLSVRSGALEPSNVDLTQQFSELILMQRGYQASSQVLSTANEMLQELLQLKGGR